MGALAVLAASCGSAPDAGSATTPPATTIDLAPSQITASTVVAPPAPDACDPDDVTTQAVAGVDAEVVVLFTNTGEVECEVSLGESWARAHDIEPDVWLAPAATAELWGECAGASAAAWDLVVNDEPRAVALNAPCDPVPVAFFPT